MFYYQVKYDLIELGVMISTVAFSDMNGNLMISIIVISSTVVVTMGLILLIITIYMEAGAIEVYCRGYES